MNKNKHNLIVLGVSCFDGMAPSMRVRNLLEPLINENSITVNNLIYESDNNGLVVGKGTINKIKYLVIQLKFSNLLSIFSYLRKGINFIRLNKSQTKKNIIYNYEYLDIKNIIFILYGKFIGYKIILDIVEDNRYYTKFPGFLNKLKISSSLLFLKLTPFIANSVLVISSHLNALMISLSKGRIPIYLIPITVDLSQFEKKIYKPSQELKILYGGSFGEKDGLEYLLKAFEEVSVKFKNVELILAGRASDADYEKLHSFIEQSACKSKIVYKGFLTPYKYYDLIKQCDILCMTRINSKFANAGFPFKLGEFLASGKAVIATNVGDVSKYLSNNRDALIISPCSHEELVEALSLLLENPEEIISLGTHARKAAECYFDSEKISQELLKIFESI